MNFVQHLQDGGTGAYAALGFGALALPVALFALVAMLNKSRSAFTLGIITTLLGLSGATLGMLGTIWGRMKVQQVLASVDSPVAIERLTRTAWTEASNSALFGFFAALVPLVLGGLSAMSGSRGSDSRGRATLSVVFMTLTALATSGAWAMWHQAPPPGRFEFDARDMDAWQFAYALEVTDADKPDACYRLSESLETYWNPIDRTEWPRVIRVPIPARLADRWKPAAHRCLQRQLATISKPGAQPQRVDGMLQSSLLHDEAQHQQLVDLKRRLSDERDAIDEIIQKHVAQVRDCYAAGRKKNPELDGNITVAFTVEPNGSTSSVKQDESSTLSDAAVTSCALNVVTRMKFAARPDGQPVDVTFPFRE